MTCLSIWMKSAFALHRKMCADQEPDPKRHSSRRDLGDPGKDGGEYVLVDLNGPWAVNAKSASLSASLRYFSLLCGL